MPVSYVLPPGKALGLKVVLPGGKPESPFASRDFRWNLEPGGVTTAPDWDPYPERRWGLHIWEGAQGDLSTSAIWNKPGVIWLAVEFDLATAVSVQSVTKVPAARTIIVGTNRSELSEFVWSTKPLKGIGMPFFREVTAGAGGYAVVGCGGKAVVGDGGVAIAGSDSYAEAGDRGNAQAQLRGFVITGIGGYSRTGKGGVSVTGAGGRAYAGDVGVAVSGAGGYSEAGIFGSCSSGVGGVLGFRSQAGVETYRVGEGGIKPDTVYAADKRGYPLGSSVQTWRARFLNQVIQNGVRN